MFAGADSGSCSCHAGYVQPVILAQVLVTNTTRTDLFTAPSGRNTWLSGVKVVNQDSNTTTYTISVAPGGAAHDAKQVWCSDDPVPPSPPVIAPMGIYLAAGDVVRVQLPGGGNVSFHALGR
jgi:hypothetical protein